MEFLKPINQSYKDKRLISPVEWADRSEASGGPDGTMDITIHDGTPRGSDKDSQDLSCPEEEHSHGPAVAVIEVGKTMKFNECPLSEPTSPNTNRRIENDTCLGLIPDHAAENSNFVKSPEEVSEEIIVSEGEQNSLTPIQEAEEKNKSSSSLVVGTFDSKDQSSNLPISQECTEDDSPCYQEGRHWEKGDVIGSGASGNIYVVIDKTRKNPQCAVKQHYYYPSRSDKREYAFNEARIMHSIQRHENVIKFFGWTSHQQYLKETFNIFMERMPGSLEDELNHGPLDENLIIDYTKQMSCGLKHFHGLNIAHRDLKPANILLDKEKHRLCICDYGEASYLNEQEDNKFFEREGTPPYMAPEVVCAYYGCGYDLKCDMWSLGCIIYAMAKGKDAPFDYQKLGFDEDPLWFPSEYYKEVYDVDSWLSQISCQEPIIQELLLSCLKLTPEERPSSSDLHNLLAYGIKLPTI